VIPVFNICVVDYFLFITLSQHTSLLNPTPQQSITTSVPQSVQVYFGFDLLLLGFFFAFANLHHLLILPFFCQFTYQFCSIFCHFPMPYLHNLFVISANLFPWVFAMSMSFSVGGLSAVGLETDDAP